MDKSFEVLGAVVSKNALRFKELVNDELSRRTVAAVEARREEAAASMFGVESVDSDDDDDTLPEAVIVDDEDEGADTGAEEVDLDEVAPAVSERDKLTKAIHKIVKTGHPAATEAQFSGTIAKDKTKHASYHDGEDELAYQASN